jgi:hypothetical protein
MPKRLQPSDLSGPSQAAQVAVAAESSASLQRKALGRSRTPWAILITLIVGGSIGWAAYSFTSRAPPAPPPPAPIAAAPPAPPPAPELPPPAPPAPAPPIPKPVVSTRPLHPVPARRPAAAELPAPPPPPALKGTVVVRATPYAEVFLGERSLGVTPLEPVELPEGAHLFRFVNKETNRAENREVNVIPGQQVIVKVDLRP